MVRAFTIIIIRGLAPLVLFCRSGVPAFLVYVFVFFLFHFHAFLCFPCAFRPFDRRKSLWQVGKRIGERQTGRATPSTPSCDIVMRVVARSPAGPSRTRGRLTPVRCRNRPKRVGKREKNARPAIYIYICGACPLQATSVSCHRMLYDVHFIWLECIALHQYVAEPCILLCRYGLGQPTCCQSGRLAMPLSIPDIATLDAIFLHCVSCTNQQLESLPDFFFVFDGEK